MRRLLLAVLALSPACWLACQDTAVDLSQPAFDSGIYVPAKTDEAGGATDAGLGDAPPGTFDENPFPGSWSHAPGVPAYCDNRVADAPATLKSRWIACPSGRAGCRRLDTSWTKAYGQILDMRETDPVRLVGGVPYFKMRRIWPPVKKPGPPMVAYVDLIEPLDGDPVLAVGSAPALNAMGEGRWCVIQATFGDYGVGFQAWPKDPSSPVTVDPPSTFVFGWAPWSAPSPLASVTWSSSTIGAPIAFFISVTMGANGFWLDTSRPQSILHFDIGTKTGTFVAGKAHDEAPKAVPGGAIAYDTDSPFSLVFLQEDGTRTRLVTPTPPQMLSWQTLDRSNGNAHVWIESSSGALNYADSTIWTAPFATNEAALVRRKVAKFDDLYERGGARGVANKGVMLNLVGRNTALLTRLSDGMGWLVQGEPLERLLDPVWVDDDDMFIITADDSEGGKFDHSAWGMLRISRASLGPPTVLSGL